MTSATLSARPATHRRALVVDDDLFMLAFMEDMLRELGAADVTTAATAAAAGAALDRMAAPPDVCLCDLNMPDTDGFQFMESLARRGYKGGVILVSGMDARTIKSATLMGSFHRLNVIGSFGKPVDPRALGDALRKLN